MSGFTIRFLTRPGCHLCDDARPHIEWAANRAGVGFRELDIDEDDRLVAVYGLRIPVVLGPGDTVIAEGIIEDRKAVLKGIRQVGES